jgi:hypothetical protein
MLFLSPEPDNDAGDRRVGFRIVGDRAACGHLVGGTGSTWHIVVGQYRTGNNERGRRRTIAVGSNLAEPAKRRRCHARSDRARPGAADTKSGVNRPVPSEIAVGTALARNAVRACARRAAKA